MTMVSQEKTQTFKKTKRKIDCRKVEGPRSPPQPRGSANSRPPRAGGRPLESLEQCIYLIVFDVLSCLDSQMTSKSDETRSVTSVIDRASQRLKNYVDTMTIPQKN